MISMETLQCLVCNTFFDQKLPTQKFCDRQCAGKYWYATHKEEEKVRTTAYTKKNPLIAKKIKLKKYGLTTDDYYRLYAEQNNVCKICKRICASGRELSVDHCHKTGKVRGLLCGKCNNALGAFEDNIEVMLVAIEYLKDNNGNVD